MPEPLIPHWIDGGPVAVEGSSTTPVTNSATGQVIGRASAGTQEDVDRAVTAACGAFPAWSETGLSRRVPILFRFRELVDRHRSELVDLIVAEHGKVVADAAGEVQRGLEVVEFACGIPHLLKGAFSEQVAAGVDSYELRQPIGVMVGITPFNFPVMVPMWMFPIAIACGNTYVLKPSEKTPSPSVRIAELLAEAGLPDGVFNVVQGGAGAVDPLLEHPDVAAVSFVGSTPVAEHVHRKAMGAGKRVQALGGAKNHAVVLPDADVDVAADALVGAAYGSAGERCMAISAVVAVGDIADPLVSAITERLKSLQVGPGDAEGTQMGPLITGEHRDRVADYVERGVAEGGRLVYDGRGLTVPGSPGGHWLGPSLFDHVSPNTSIYRDEIFGPVLVVLRTGTFDEALGVVNANRWANGAAVFTADGRTARRFQHGVKVGMVGINVPIPVPMAYYSFGGWKDSFFGDLRVHGVDGVRFATQGKVVTSRWPSTRPAGVDLGFSSEQ